MVGIYKWTSPTNRIYIGQSKDLEVRKKWYLSGGLDNASMPKIKRSFEKYGIKNHIWEIIEICSIEELDEKEIYWGLYYNTLEEGLNCKLGEQNSIFSEETKSKMRRAKQGFKLSPESEVKRQASLRKVWVKKNRIREEKKKNKPKYIPTKEHKENISKGKLGKPIHTKESKQKLSIIGKNRPWLKKMQKQSLKSTSKPVSQYDLKGNFIKTYNSGNEAERALNNKPGDNIMACVRGKQKTAYGFIWKSK